MGLFCGKKCRCQRRGKSYFSGQPDLERAFSKACDGNTDLERDDFLCSGKYMDQRAIILNYGYDPCVGDNITVQNVLDPTNQRDENNADFKSSLPVIGVIGGLIAVGIIVLYFINRK